jgi:hypothetical protein
LRLVRSTTKITSIFEDLGVLISITLVLSLSILGGRYLHYYRFDWFTLNSSWVILLLQRWWVGFFILWVRFVFIFNRQRSDFWARFGYLASFSSKELGQTINIRNTIIWVWEAGWVETLGPLYLQKATQNFTHLVYLLSLLNYKTILSLFIIGLTRIILIV